MSCGKLLEDFNMPVGELTNLMNDTFTCCMRHYEALLPYLEKKETKPKIYHKLVHINILLNKLNEELVALRVEYATVSSCEQKRETVLSEGNRKRRLPDVFDAAKQETKSTKTKVPFSGSAKCSAATTSGTEINMESYKSVSMDAEETRYTQAQKSEMHKGKNIKTEIQNSDEVEDLLVEATGDIEISAVQTSCDYISGDEENASEAERLVEGNTYDKPADTITQSESNEESIPLQKVESKSYIEEKKTGSKDHSIYRALGGEVNSIASFSYQTNRCFNRKESPAAFTTFRMETDPLLQGRSNISNKEKKRKPNFSVRCEKDKLPVQISEELCSAENELYGIIRYKHGRYRCTLCDRELFDYNSMQGHVKGKKHKINRETAKNGCAQMSKAPNNNCKSKDSVSACPDISCSLDDNLTIVECRHEVISMIQAVRLDDMWKYFDAKFHINKKFFRIHLGQVICYLCNEQIGRNVLSVKKHISRFRHLHRINILTEIELKNKSSNTELLDIPGFLKDIIPMTEFSLEKKGFLCTVCDCFCKNEVVLSHMTGIDHRKKMKEIVV